MPFWTAQLVRIVETLKDRYGRSLTQMALRYSLPSGMGDSLIRPSAMPSWTALFTMPIG
jgi:hypothetical protein